MKKDKALPQVGDTITILRREDTMWSSSAGGKCPDDKKIQYPFTGKILAINTEYGYSSINIDGWGFDIGHIAWQFAPQNSNIYEIY